MLNLQVFEGMTGRIPIITPEAARAQGAFCSFLRAIIVENCPKKVPTVNEHVHWQQHEAMVAQEDPRLQLLAVECRAGLACMFLRVLKGQCGEEYPLKIT